MIRSFAVGLAAMCLLGGSPAWPDTVLSSSMKSRLTAAQTMEPTRAHAEILRVTEEPRFADLTPSLQSEIWVMAARAAMRGRNGVQALKDADTAVRLDGSAQAYSLRLAAARAVGDKAKQISSLQALLTEFPSTLASLTDQVVIAALQPAADGEDQEAARASLADALLKQWRPQDPLIIDDDLRLLVVKGRLASGRVGEARVMASEIGTRDQQILLRADRQFEGLFEDGWLPPTPRAASEASLVSLRAVRRLYPRRLRGGLMEAERLSELGAHAEALALVEDLLTRAKTDPAGFDDAREMLSWLQEQRAILLISLDRADEGRSAFEEAAGVKERGTPNVSQILNLAGELSEVAPSETLRLVAEVESRPVTDYGRAAGLSARVCAHAKLGDRAKAQEAFSALETLVSKTPAAIRTAMLAAWCLGDEDAAAKQMITLLQRSPRDATTLLLLQYEIPPSTSHTTYGEARARAMARRLASRADVQAAFAPRGRIVSLPWDALYRPAT